MNAAAIRHHNLLRVFHAIRETPGISQRSLAERTRIDKATTSTVVRQLHDAGLLERSPKPNPKRAGRPEVALRVSPAAGILIGARLEPATIRLLATHLDGTPVARLQVPSSRDVDDAVARLWSAVHDLQRRASAAGPNELRALGVGVPGLTRDDGRLVLAPNLGWRDVPLQDALRANATARVWLDNDTKAAALAERLFGSCAGVDDFVFVTGHSGVGGGLYLDGGLYRGASGFAGEIGHVKVEPGGRACGCGGRGCLEAYVSEASILRRLSEAGVDASDVWHVAALAESRDERVTGLLRETGTILGVALANLVNTVNPERVVLGGNLAVLAPHLLGTLEATLHDNTLEPLRVDVRVSPLGADSVPMGGVALALEGFLSEPESFPAASAAVRSPPA